MLTATGLTQFSARILLLNWGPLFVHNLRLTANLGSGLYPGIGALPLRWEVLFSRGSARPPE